MAKVPNAIENRNVTENYNRLIRVHDRQDRRQTDGQATAYSEREHEFTFSKTVVH